MTARERAPAVYILTNRPFGTLYIGVTADLPARIWQHQNDIVEGFTKTYATHRLVWYEMHQTMYSAITREKQLKKWLRRWKIQLIVGVNADWRDLSEDIR